MFSGTKVRTLGRHLENSGAILWVIGGRDELIYLSSAAANWLGVEGIQLQGRRCVPPLEPLDDRLDRIAASLAPPPGLSQRGWLVHRIAPPADPPGDAADSLPLTGRPSESPGAELRVGFASVGQQSGRIVIALAGDFPDGPPAPDPEHSQSIAIRQALDRWRQAEASRATIATAGVSAAARRARARLQLASAHRTHIGLFGPPGFGGTSIANRLHHHSAPGEPLVVVDGPLMDVELFEATLGPLVAEIADGAIPRGTTLVRSLDEMPLEAQARLAQWLSESAGRLRLIATANRRPREVFGPDRGESPDTRADATGPGGTDQPFGPADDESPVDPPGPAGTAPPAGVILTSLADAISIFPIGFRPLCQRPQDIPLIASALVDGLHAIGEGRGERLSRAATDALVIYPWPGDFEELDATIRHAVRASRGPTIAPEDLPLAVRSFRPADPSADFDEWADTSLEEALGAFERRLIRQALDATGGNRAEAARRLGISRAKLLRRLSDPEPGGTARPTKPRADRGDRDA